MTYSYTDLLAIFGIGGAHPGGLTLSRAVLSELDISEETELLEVGCGTGQTTALILDQFPCQLYAIDHHPVMIEKTQSRLADKTASVKLVKASVENLPFENKKFDHILSESVTAFTNTSTSLCEYSRVLKDEGQLVLIEMAGIQPLSEQETNEITNFYGFHAILSEEEWLQSLKNAGFKNVNTFSISLEELIRDEDDFTEFNMSPGIDPSLFEKLDKHNHLTEQYKNKLGFRVFFCKKA